VLGNIAVNGRRIKAVMQPSRQLTARMLVQRS
jgi:hypothetical protein